MRVRYANEVQTGPSGLVWDNFPEKIVNDPALGYHFFDDFAPFHPIAASGVSGPWYGFIDTGDTIKPLVTEVGGVIQIATAGTDNNGPVLSLGTEAASATGVPFKFVSKGASVWFETRIRLASASLAENALFIGFAEEARAVDNGLMVNDTGVAADVDYIAFTVPTHVSASVMSIVHKVSGQTAVVDKSSALTMALATWYKLGMRYNAQTDVISWFIDNALVYSTTLASLGTTSFPSGEEMSLYIGLKTGEGAIKKLDVDWVRVAMTR